MQRPSFAVCTLVSTDDSPKDFTQMIYSCLCATRRNLPYSRAYSMCMQTPLGQCSAFPNLSDSGSADCDTAASIFHLGGSRDEMFRLQVTRYAT